MKNPNHPNVFMVGFPKCGTSSMTDLLSQHPEVFVCPIKEPNYYAPDLLPINPVRDHTDRELYLKLFDAASPKQHKIIVDASIAAILSPSKGVCEIKKDYPDAKIIVMLRNPLDAALSLYLQADKAGHPDSASNFEQAWYDHPNRLSFVTNQKNISTDYMLNYAEVYSYHKHLTKLYEVFSASNIHIIIFDDFIRNTLIEFKKLCGFLEIDSSFEPEIVHSNPAGVVRFRRINKALCLFELKTRKFRKMCGFPSLSLRKKLMVSYNEKNIIKNKEISSSLKDDMKSFYRNDIEKLGYFINRDLSTWLE